MVLQNDISSNLPLTEATLLIMLSLSQSPKHGYAIMKEVQELSENRVVMSTGTLYGALKRLLEQGWIERLDIDKEDGEEGQKKNGNPRMRKAYLLSRYGRRILEAEIGRMKKLLASVELQKLGSQA